ncbi:MAG TPA: hypothetical protein VEH47_00650, partial [Candidatus Acidoferrales bacterium]|nr:hypothetical protein [Candidatus Acidoferrales bacterium]
MKRGLIVLLSFAAGLAQQRPDVIYDEAKVPAYTLPDVLGPARTAKDWPARREQILEIYRAEVFGRSPAKPANLKFTVESVDNKALGGRAVRKLVTISLGGGPAMHMLLYLPAAKRTAPVFLGLSFSGNQTVSNDPGIPLGEEWVRDPDTKQMVKRTAPESSRGRSAAQWQLDSILAHGYGLATIYYGEIEPDFDGGIRYGVRPLFFKPGQTEPAANDWGAIGAWAWGLSRAMDYLETDPGVDAAHVAVFGHSRLGKTALWAGAQDTRFALVISNESGEGGAAISRRDYGERTEDLNTRFPHWFCLNFRKYNGHEDQMPFDSHFLLGLIAPRALYVASAEGDQWSDPRGEFLGAVGASRVYELLGKPGLGTDQMPELHQPVMHTVAYHIRAGKHDVTAY